MHEEKRIHNLEESNLVVSKLSKTIQNDLNEEATDKYFDNLKFLAEIFE